MAKVSVIVPVFNKSLYLRECLDSLINQTLQDIEILCIDDKSTDNSLDILLEYAQKDTRIHVFKQETNRGVSIARNLGIQKAKGEFIAFVDADDFVDLEFYEKLYSASDGYDCIKGEIWDYDAEIGNCAVNSICNLNETIKQTGNPFYFYYGFTSAIYRKTLIDRFKLHFQEDLSYNEDPLFNINVMAKLSVVKIVDGARYYYRTVSSSLSHNLTDQKIDEFCCSVVKMFSSLEKCNISHENRYIVANQLFKQLGTFITEGQLTAEKFKIIEQKFLTFFGKPHTDGFIKASVIVPVYNGEKYLRRTLSCLTLQSLYDIEIICVNDKSQDNSLRILKEYQKRDSRIKVIDCKENGGESKARNLGIKAASGEFLAFMDQDDLADLVFYEQLYSKAIETDADIIKGGVSETDYSGQVQKRNFYKFDKQPLYFSGDWWTAIYKRSLIENSHIELPEGFPLGGDLKFLFDACAACTKLSVVNGVNYYHIMHPDSGDSEKTSLPKIKSVIEILSYILNKLEEFKLFEKDKDCYVYYYYFYIFSIYSRIQRCPELEGKMLCSDFIFKLYDTCKYKKEVLDKLKQFDILLAESLEKHQREFFNQLIEQEVLNNVFYEEFNTATTNTSVACSIIVPFINQEPLEKYIIKNVFLKKEKQILFNLIDNRPQNRPISAIYNEFLDNYDYTKESWLVFMHSDFEFLTYPSNVLSQLNTSKIYGPIGAIVYKTKDKMFVSGKGSILEKAPDNSFFQNFKLSCNNLCVDTLDCLCLIVHSSLVEKYHLRFDENTTFDLYVEDFCINANKEYGIPVEAVCFDCAHHSSYIKEKYFSKRYLKQLQYVNNKYPNDIYGGTVTPIGGKILPKMTEQEFKVFKIRHELLTGEKL